MLLYTTLIATCVAVILGDNTYYVSSSTSDCPQPCHPLSYYITNTTAYFTSNATFIFKEGEHLLDNKGLIRVVIASVDNLTLRGERGIGVTIRCSNNTRTLVLTNCNIVNIYGITITECGQQHISPILLGLGSGLYINCRYLTITSTTFSNNIIGNIGGGLGIHITTDYNDITIINSTFIDNKVEIGGGLTLYLGSGTCNSITISDSVFASNNVSNMGGGLAIAFEANTHNNIVITNNIFTNNFGNTSGGLIIGTLLDSSGTHNNITVSNSTFTDNVFNKGSGLAIIFAGNDMYNHVTITNSIFANNTGDISGAGLSVLSNGKTDYITITNSMFTKSFYGLILEPYFAANVSTNCNKRNVVIINATIAFNTKAGLVLFAENDSKAKLSQVIVSNNSGSGIVAFSQYTVVFTKGHSIIANNSSPTDGGGVYLDKNSHLTSSNGGQVSFINNTAQRYGGAIYCHDSDYAAFSRIINYNNGKPCTVYSLSANFINNSAGIAGDQLYGGNFFFCERSALKISSEHNIVQCPNVPAVMKNVTSIHPLSPISSDPLMVCPCVDSGVNCTSRFIYREVYPGQVFHLLLATIGLCGGISPGILAINNSNFKEINLVSGTTTDYMSTSCTTLNYTAKVTTYIPNTTLTLNVARSTQYYTEPINVHLTILPCPLGLILDSTLGECACNNDIVHISGVECNISWMPQPIQRSGNNWIAYQYGNYDCIIVHTGCPFDYCNVSPVKFSLSNPDHQCSHSRSGILCGQCEQGLSLMLGSNRCHNCTDTGLISVSIIIITALAGILLVLFLMILNLTVSVGSINGLFLYANIIKLNESIFFSQGNIPVVSQFISWCNLDLGFEYCFVNGLDGYKKIFLQFVFPVYLWILVITIILGCRYSSRLCHLCGRNAVPVLATLILMSYTKISRTVTNALMINTIQCGMHKWNVWNVDGNIGYFSNRHILLFTASLLFLIAGLVYTGLVFCSQWLQRYSGKCCKSTRDPVVQLKPLIDAHTGPFKDKYRFWTGLCLLVRLTLVVIFLFTTTLQSKLNNYIILVVIGSMIIFIVGAKVYKNNYLTILETFSFVNIVCISVMTILFTESYHGIVSVTTLVSVSVSIEILLFVIVVGVHCLLAFKKVFPNCELSVCCISYESKDCIAGDINVRQELMIFDP